MAYSNTTSNYNLPIYSAGDIASWTDTNQPFEDIDAATHTAYQTAASAAQDVTTLDGTVTTLSGTVAGHTSTLSTLTNTTIPALQNSVLGAATANGTSYSNTSSGLVATDVQDAIDEVNSNLNDVYDYTFIGQTNLQDKTTITIPDQYKELEIFCTHGVMANINLDVIDDACTRFGITTSHVPFTYYYATNDIWWYVLNYNPSTRELSYTLIDTNSGNMPVDLTQIKWAVYGR